MLEPQSGATPMSLRGRMRAAQALLREHRAEIVAAAARQAGAGDRAAMRLAHKHGLPVEPPPDVLAARLAESIKRTRATVATLLAEGGIAVGRSSRRHDAPRNPATGHPAGVGNATKEAATLVNNNENTSGTEDSMREVDGNTAIKPMSDPVRAAERQYEAAAPRPEGRGPVFSC